MKNKKIQNEILELTKELISIESTKDNIEELHMVLDIAKKHLAGFNFKEYEFDNKPGLLVYNTPKMPEKFSVIFNAHLDVVEAKSAQFKPVVKGDKLFGRGAIDMKAAAACEILAFKNLAKKVNFPLGLQLITDEEINGHGTRHQIEKGVRADFVIIGEPTNFFIRHESKNPHWVKLTAKGKPAHAAYLWQGENAINKMINALNRILEQYPVPKDKAWRTTINVSRIYTKNQTCNSVPEDCEAILDIRTTKTEFDSIIPTMKKLVGSGIIVEEILRENGYYTDKDNKYIKALQKSLPESNRELDRAYGGCDLRYYEKAGGAGVEFGPTGSGHHADDEWVSIKGLGEYYTVLEKFLMSISYK